MKLPRTWHPVASCIAFVLFLFVPHSNVPAVEPLPDGTAKGVKVIAGFRVPEGLKVELFAAEPQLASPVAICLDEQGRVYVAEEYRFNLGTEENRTRPFLLEDDLQIRTLDDRLAMFKKWAGKFDGGMDWFTKTSDQLRLVEDRDGDGRADFSSVFASEFNGPLDGLAAGVIAREGNIYFTCIPSLWLLRDNDGDGKAEVRKSLHRGFGVNAAFLGHDLHGLVWGPDGKLYFSVGDRGFHLTTPEGQTLSGPRTGAVFRCNADGSQLEVVARGMRNPQELAFDPYGNLFAADNNSDQGDHARLVWVVEGGDSGWNMAYQSIPAPYRTGPWHAERIWHMPNPGQPAWIVPPVGKLGAGPSGFVQYSGTGLADRYRDHFFMCNYTGNGGVESFAVERDGAGFKIVDYHDFFKPLQATDIDFGYDGKMYVSDFVQLLWNGGSGGGRIYTVFDPTQQNDPVIRETRALFKSGFAKLSDAELGKLLAHADMRARLRAQYQLAERGPQSAEVFRNVLRDSTDRLPRLHAVWGLGQIGRQDRKVLAAVAPLVSDADLEIRVQAIKVLGDGGWTESADAITAALADSALAVRFAAAMALGKLHHKQAVDAVFAMLAENDDKDPHLRHAGVIALVGIGDSEAVQSRAKDANRAVRMAVLLTMRRASDPRIGQFLEDSDALLVTEAARAINDLPLDELTPALAKLADRYGATVTTDLDPLLRRIINANFRLGEAAHVAAVVDIASNPNHSPAVREEAIAALADWSQPPPRDRVNGFWRPLGERDPKIVRGVLEPRVARLLASASGPLQVKATELITKLNLRTDDNAFFAWVKDRDRDTDARVAALRLLVAKKYPQLRAAIEAALDDAQPRLRAEARDALATLDADQALLLLETALDNSGAATIERQRALATLAAAKSMEADALLAKWAERLATGDVAVELQLDVAEAAALRNTAPLRAALDKFRAAQASGDRYTALAATLAGGDAANGRALFVGHRTAQCIRCHKIHGEGGVAGPDLSKVAERNDRQYLLHSLIDPNEKIASGFGNLTLVLDSGKTLVGTLKSEDANGVVLELPTGAQVTVPLAEIEERSTPQSAMPAMDKTLTLRELRDLVEYLATLK